jgi:hypothetical protein
MKKSLTIRVFGKDEKTKRATISYAAEGFSETEMGKLRKWLFGEDCNQDNKAKTQMTVNIIE